MENERACSQLARIALRLGQPHVGAVRGDEPLDVVPPSAAAPLAQGLDRGLADVGQGDRVAGRGGFVTRSRRGREILQAAGSDLTSVIVRWACGLRSPSLSTCRPSATARSAAAAILDTSALGATGPLLPSGRPASAGTPQN